jgi:[ribosomal protein S5]-alanine N-acetyltransferase
MNCIEIKKMKLPAYTSKLLLRKHVYADWETVFDYSRRDDYRRYMPLSAPSPDSAQRFILKILDNQVNVASQELNVAVCRRDGKQLIGDVRLVLASAKRKEAHIGYALNPSEWGNGYAVDAVTAVVAHGFAVGLHRIAATCDVENFRSRRILEKAGLRHEGTLRKYMQVREEWRDCFIFGIIAEDLKNAG